MDRTIRSLALLEAAGSTARVFNLHAIGPAAAVLAEGDHKPFFQNRKLNSAIIVKHRVRAEEQHLFRNDATGVTKVMLPLDPHNLRAGAWFLMLGQRDFDEAAEALVGRALTHGAPDREVLEALAALPSLDPFLLHDAMVRLGRDVSRGYFTISAADLQKMHDFVRHEIEPLVRLSIDGAGSVTAVNRLVEKLLAPAAAEGLEPLRNTLKLSDSEFTDGVFAWRGFLYYKWVAGGLHRRIARAVVDLGSLQNRLFGVDADRQSVIASTRAIEERITSEVSNVESSIRQYDQSYQALLSAGDAGSFRGFLLNAPEIFQRLGASSGVLQDAASFWTYLKPQMTLRTPGREVAESLRQFEDCLFLEAG